MDLKKVAIGMKPFITKSTLPNHNDSYGKDHMFNMVEKISNGAVDDEKAHRWLGYIQGCVVSHKGATLEEMKQINVASL